MIGNAGVRGNANDAIPKLSAVRESLMGFVSSQYAGPAYQNELPFIKNTLAHTFAVLALATYPARWPTFVKDIVVLTGLPASAGPLAEESAKAANNAAINPYLVDFLLRTLSSLDEVMVNPTVPRSAEEIARNTEIKDAMRVEDVSRLAHAWFDILVHMSTMHSDLAKSALRLVGAYVSWIDISLIVNQPFMNILFGLLKTPALRCQACHCLVEIIGKGMRALDKLYLLQFLGIVAVMKQLDVSEVEFAEEAGKLANITGIELSAIWSDKETATPEARATACGMLEELMPFILTFLAHEYDEVSSSVFPVITEILGMLKRTQREGASLSAPQQEFLSRLLPVLVEKLKYNEDYSWPSPNDSRTAEADASLDEDDDEAMFSELRRSLRTFIDAIAVIAPGLYDNIMLTTAQNIFKQCNQYGVSADRAADEGGDGSGQLGWVRAELGIYLTQAYGDRLSSNKGLRFGSAKHGQTNGSHHGSNNTSGLSTESFSELLTMMIQSGIINCNHPAIAPMYFENLVRFNGYFDVQREAITPVLTSFLSATGVRHPQNFIRPRIWYLLRRFIEQHSNMGLAVYSRDFISAVADLLNINASPSSVTGTHGIFDSQLYLFEACGIMLALSDLDDGTRTTLLQHLFNPLFSGAQALMNSRSADQLLQDSRLLLQMHHYLMAIGAIVSGFPNIRVDSKTTSAGTPHQLSANTTQVFLKAADMCIAVLEVLRTSQLIREASRATLSRMLSVLGTDALQYLPRLIDSLVSNCVVEELLDLLGLIGLVVFKFKPHVAPTASELLLPVISKVYGFLDKVAQDGATGTDEAVLLQDLRKAYLSWIGALFNSDLDSIFLAPQNAQHLVTIFHPIATQLAVDHNNAQCQRLAFNVIFKAIQAWVVDPLGYHTLATLTPAAIAALNSNNPESEGKGSNKPLLRQASAQALGLDLASNSTKEARSQFKHFVMNTVVPLCFEAPTRPQFQISDAQASLVVSEITGVLQMLLVAGLPAVADGDGSTVAAMPAPQLLNVPIGGDLSHNQFASYLSTALLPSMGCPANMATEFVQALATLGQKQFKKYFIAFLTNSS
ncbi:armadillo-type protein [Coemansia spiralis]|nr:armadillo-type protein [Coemansia spiralis]